MRCSMEEPRGGYTMTSTAEKEGIFIYEVGGKHDMCMNVENRSEKWKEKNMKESVDR